MRGHVTRDSSHICLDTNTVIETCLSTQASKRLSHIDYMYCMQYVQYVQRLIAPDSDPQ